MTGRRSAGSGAVGVQTGVGQGMSRSRPPRRPPTGCPEPPAAGWCWSASASSSAQPVDGEDHQDNEGADGEAGVEVQQGVAPELVFAYVVALAGCRLWADRHGVLPSWGSVGLVAEASLAWVCPEG